MDVDISATYEPIRPILDMTEEESIAAGMNIWAEVLPTHGCDEVGRFDFCEGNTREGRSPLGKKRVKEAGISA